MARSSRRAEALWGAGDMAHLMGDDPRTRVPWPQMPWGMRPRLDPEVTGSWPHAPVAEIDPRTLHASQDYLVADALDHYMHVPHGALYDHEAGPSNSLPLVYRSTDPSYPHDIILAGHHRSAAALLRGEMVRARLVVGGLLPPRPRRERAARPFRFQMGPQGRAAPPPG